MKTGAGRSIQEGQQVGVSFLIEPFAEPLLELCSRMSNPVLPVERIGSAIVPFAGKRLRKRGEGCSTVACYRELT